MMDLLSLREAYLPEPLPLAKRKRARMNSFHTGFHDVAFPFASAPPVGAPETRTSASSIRTVTVGPGLSPGQPALLAQGRGLAVHLRRLSLIHILMPVFSLPSENVPAPPSPNWMFVRSSSGAPALKASTISTRSSTEAPRSTTSGRNPARARYSAQNSPAGPAPVSYTHLDVYKRQAMMSSRLTRP